MEIYFYIQLLFILIMVVILGIGAEYLDLENEDPATAIVTIIILSFIWPFSILWVFVIISHHIKGKNFHQTRNIDLTQKINKDD